MPPTSPAKVERIDELLGFTRAECGVECTEERCVITREPVCGHPFKGGLQARYQGNKDAVARYNKVRRILLRQQVDQQEERARV